MTHHDTYKVDRSGWRSGAWDNEPDLELFEYAGMRCAIVRCRGGHLCGYVRVEPGHVLHGIDYSDVDYDRVDPHGGLTFGRMLPDDALIGGGWWLGFDCNHYGDATPECGEFSDTIYRGFGFVRREVRRMAEQIAAYVEPA